MKHQGSVTSFSLQLDFSACIFSPVVSPSPRLKGTHATTTRTDLGITSDALAYKLTWLEIFQGELMNSSAEFGLQKKKDVSSCLSKNISLFYTSVYII